MKFTGNIRLRLTLWYALVLVVVLLAFSIIVYALLSNNLNRRFDEEVRLRTEHLSGVISTNDESEVLGEIKIGLDENLNFQTQPDESAQVFGVDGTRLLALGLHVDNAQIQSIVALALQGKSHYINTAADNGDKMRVYAAPLFYDSKIIGAVLLGRSTVSVRSVLDTFKNMAFISTLLIVLLAGGGGFFLTSRALRPVIRITRTARDIGDGDLNRRIEVLDGDEIGRLAATLNKMFDRLQSAFVRERRFTSDASHELRTPLAIIEAEATLALERTRSTNDYKKALGVIAQEATHMSRLINDLLYLARSEAGKEQLAREPIKLGEFIKDLASDVSVLCRRKKLKLKVDRLDNPVVRGDATRLRQLFLNILENAIRYTAPGGIISVLVTLRDSMAVVQISDTGIGIPPAELDHIFEPFFRVDTGRARSEGGSGLGLAIVQRIAEAHRGRVEVESRMNKGSTFSVFLPVDLADQPQSTSLGKSKSGTEQPRRSRLFFWK